VQPAADQGGFAIAGRGRDQDELPLDPGIQLLDQPLAENQIWPQGRRKKLCGKDGRSHRDENSRNFEGNTIRFKTDLTLCYL
jgi:hypothetical protein